MALQIRDGVNAKLYTRLQCFQAAYWKYKGHIFNLIPNTENKNRGIRGAGKSFIHQENSTFLMNCLELKDFEFIEIYGVVLKPGPDAYEPGYIYPDLAIPYLKDTDRKFLKKLLIAVNADKEGDDDRELVPQKPFHMYKGPGNVHEESTYIHDVVSCYTMNEKKFVEGMMESWMGQWEFVNPISNDDPFNSFVRLGLVTKAQLIEFEVRYDCRFQDLYQDLAATDYPG